MARQLRLRVKDGTTRCACERSSTWEAAWKLPEITQAARVRMGVGKRDLQWACALVCAVRSEDGRGQAGSPVGMRVGVRSEE